MATLLQVYTNGGPPIQGDSLNTCEYTCDNVVTLRGFIGRTGMQVYIRGTTTPGDGGQGPFYWNASGSAPDDNGVTTIVPTGVLSGEWTRLPFTAVGNLSVSGNLSVGGTLAVTGAATLSGGGTTPTLAAGNNSTSLPTTAYIDRAKNFNFAPFATSGTFTSPSTINSNTVFKITLVGGGGGGGGTSATACVAQSGGAGCVAVIFVSGLVASTGYTVTIGAAGSGGNTSGTSGTNGGNTAITIGATTYTANGGTGGGGASSATSAVNAAQGTASSSITSLTNYYLLRQDTTSGAVNTITLAPNGSSTLFGTGGGGGQGNAGTGSAASGYGAGGGAAGSSSGGAAANGGNGAPGYLTIEWVF